MASVEPGGETRFLNRPVEASFTVPVREVVESICQLRPFACRFDLGIQITNHIAIYPSIRLTSSRCAQVLVKLGIVDVPMTRLYGFCFGHGVESAT